MIIHLNYLHSSLEASYKEAQSNGQVQAGPAGSVLNEA